MRILMVGGYPPARDGIAAYTAQAVRSLRAAGDEVQVCSPEPSAAHHHRALAGPRGALALRRLAVGFDRVVLQFHPDVFYPRPVRPGSEAATSLAFAALARGPVPVEVVVHELVPQSLAGDGPSQRAARAFWRAVDRVVVHTPGERTALLAVGLDPDRVVVRPHGRDFVSATGSGRAEARAALGIGAAERLVLCIGFFGPHKGFDRAVRAFAGLAPVGVRLEVVGSLRQREASDLADLAALRALVGATPGASLREGFLTDGAFDRWLLAADLVLLPYRQIWSSGVLERALLHGREALATDVGGLAGQVAGRTGVTVVADDDAALAVALAAWAGVGDVVPAAAAEAGAAPPAPAAGGWPEGPGPLRAVLQAEVRARAAAGAGVGAGAAAEVTAPLRRLGPLVLPGLDGRGVLASAARRVVRRLTAWEIEPVVAAVNALREAEIEAHRRAVADREP